MTSKKKNFLEIRLCNKITVTDVNENSVKSEKIKTIQLDLDKLIIYIDDVHYTLNIMFSLIFYDQLNCQEFSYNLILMISNMYVFEITNT